MVTQKTQPAVVDRFEQAQMAFEAAREHLDGLAAAHQSLDQAAQTLEGAGTAVQELSSAAGELIVRDAAVEVGLRDAVSELQRVGSSFDSSKVLEEVKACRSDMTALSEAVLKLTSEVRGLSTLKSDVSAVRALLAQPRDLEGLVAPLTPMFSSLEVRLASLEVASARPINLTSVREAVSPRLGEMAARIHAVELAVTEDRITPVLIPALDEVGIRLQAVEAQVMQSQAASDKHATSLSRKMASTGTALAKVLQEGAEASRVQLERVSDVLDSVDSRSEERQAILVAQLLPPAVSEAAGGSVDVLPPPPRGGRKRFGR